HRLEQPPPALTRQRRARWGGELERDVRLEGLGLLVVRGGAGRHGQREARLAAHLGRVVADPLAERHHRAEVVVPGPFGQLGGGRPAAGRGQRLPDGESDPAQEDGEQGQDYADRAEPEETADPAAPPAGWLGALRAAGAAGISGIFWQLILG